MLRLIRACLFVAFACGTVAAAPADGACEAAIRIFEFKSDGTSADFPVANADVRLFANGSSKRLRPAERDGIYSIGLKTGIAYRIEVRKPGFKTTRASAGCWPEEGETVTNLIFFLWPGPAAETVEPPSYVGRVRIRPSSEPELGKGATVIGESAKAGMAGIAIGTDGRTVNVGVANGIAGTLVRPKYPAAARAVRASGAVNIQVTIDELGNVVAAKAVSGHPLLRAAAVQAARESKFKTTTLEGWPVRVKGVIVYNFAP
jgi:TonB family protein